MTSLQKYVLARVILAVIGLLVFAVWWTGAFMARPTTYAVPASEAQHMIEKVGLPPVFGERPPTATVESRQGHVEWIVRQDGDEVMRYVVDLVPIDAGHTRLTLAMKGVTEGKFGNVDERIHRDWSIRNLYLAAMKEQLDSVLAHHPFRFTAISGRLAAAEFAHMRDISGWMDRAADAQHREERANVEKTYRDAGLD